MCPISELGNSAGGLASELMKDLLQLLASGREQGVAISIVDWFTGGKVNYVRDL